MHPRSRRRTNDRSHHEGPSAAKAQPKKEKSINHNGRKKGIHSIGLSRAKSPRRQVRKISFSYLCAFASLREIIPVLGGYRVAENLPVTRKFQSIEMQNPRGLRAHCQQPAPAWYRFDDAGAHQVMPNLCAHVGERGLAEFFLQRRDDMQG